MASPVGDKYGMLTVLSRFQVEVGAKPYKIDLMRDGPLTSCSCQ
jgi:hypothetical protein